MNYEKKRVIQIRVYEKDISLFRSISKAKDEKQSQTFSRLLSYELEMQNAEKEALRAFTLQWERD